MSLTNEHSAAQDCHVPHTKCTMSPHHDECCRCRLTGLLGSVAGPFSRLIFKTLFSVLCVCALLCVLSPDLCYSFCYWLQTEALFFSSVSCSCIFVYFFCRWHVSRCIQAALFFFCFLVFFWPVDFCAILDILANHHKHSCLLKPFCVLQVVATGAIVYVVPDVPLQKDWACCEDLVINILCDGTQRNKENCMFNSDSKTFIQGKMHV